MSLLVDIVKKLDGFTLQVKFETEGGVLGLLGASGCGKSMTLKCIAGIETPDSGRIILDGVTLYDSKQHICLPPQQRHVGYLFQSYALFPNMTVRQNILCGLHGEKDKHRREAEVKRVAELLQLQGLLHHKPHQLSGGQAQRTALARILVSRPKLLMLDEPFSALDSHLRVRLQWELRELLSQLGQSVLLVTHDRDEAYHLCADIAVMDAGRILVKKPTKALFADPGSMRAAQITGCKNITPARRLSEYELEAPEWGIRLTTAFPVPDDVCAVGIRAHYFNPKAPGNNNPVRLVGQMEEPFEWILEFRWAGQQEGSTAIWWRIPKDKRPAEFPPTLGVSPANVLPLTKP
ncbi:MAG: sulfate/molybdate ABC transporter ATP-binding protein [Aristaeellaceae bacterium]